MRTSRIVVVHPPSGEVIPTMDSFSHLLVTGSEASVLERAEWTQPVEEAIRQFVEHDRPILASCFGHQLLVSALSGPQFVRRSPHPEVGWIRIEHLEEDELLQDVPDPWSTFSFHFDEVVDPPPPWRVLASSTDCPTQVLRFGDAPVWGIQPHPELPLAQARLFLLVYLLFASRDRRRLVRALRRPPVEDRVIDRIVARFLQQGDAG